MPRILLVEDNELNRDMLSRRLTRRGYDVATAADGEEGLARAASDAPDLVLMDMSLPGIDGWEATRRLKAASATRHIPVIALTAHAMTGDRERALEAGCDEFDTKPVEFARLVEKIDRLLPKGGAKGGATKGAPEVRCLTLEHASLEHLPALRAFVLDACRGAGEEVQSAFELAVDEACTNVIEHGYAGGEAGPITIEVAPGSEQASVTILDRGRPFDPSQAPAPSLDESWETRAVGGLGWHLIRQVVDEVRYTADATTGNRLTLVKRVPTRHQA